MGNFWKTIGHIFASIGKGAAIAAVWASQHPEVISQVSNIAVAAGVKPGIVAGVDTGIGIATKVVSAVAPPPDQTNPPA